MEQTIEINKTADEIIYCGIGQNERVVHFGACDKGLNFINKIDEFALDIEYTAVDISDDIHTIFTNNEPLEKTHNWSYNQESIQEFIDNNDYNQYDWSIITGIFDKPLYSERQYQFIDTIIRECFKFSTNVVFSIKEFPTPVYRYSMVYLFQHFTSLYNHVCVKKISENNYIFYIRTTE